MSHNADKLTVLMLTSTMAAGGSGRFLATLIEHLDRDQFAPQLATVFDAEIEYEIPSDTPLLLVSEEPRIVPSVDMGISSGVMSEPGGDGPWVQAVVDKIAHLVRRTRPDVVLCAPEWASVLAAAASEGFSDSTRLICRVGAPPSVAFPLTGRTLLYAELLRSNFNKAECVIANSRAIAADLVANFGVDEERVVLLHNPIDVAKVESLAADELSEDVFGEGCPVAVFVGRLERVKGIEFFLRAIAAVNAVVPMRCVLVGDGSQRGYLEALVKHLEIERIVHFAGTQTNPYKYMSRGAVFVLPSLSEGMPNVLLEAMACGCPVVASDIPGGVTRELLADGACGLIVPPGDEQALEAAILRVVQDDELRGRLIAEGTEQVRRFDLPQTLRESQELFLAVATGPVVGGRRSTGTVSDCSGPGITPVTDPEGGSGRLQRGPSMVSRALDFVRDHGVRGLVARLSERLGADPAKAIVSSDPVGIPRDEPTRPLDAETMDWLHLSGPVFVCVQESCNSSGADVLLEALALARRRDDVRCAVISDGAPTQKLREATVRLGIDDAVRLIGDLGMTAGYLKDSFAYVSPGTELGSGLPPSLVVAVASGRPVVATRASDAVAQFLGDSERGVLVPRGDVEALAEAMLQLVWDDEFRTRATRQAQECLESASRNGAA